MITKAEAVVLVHGFLEGDLKKEIWFQSVQEYLKAIVLYGSVAKDSNHPDSDVDVLCIMPLEVEEKYTEGEYVYRYRGFDINIVCRSIEKLRALAKSEEKDSFQREVFRGAEIIWEADDEVRTLIQAL